MFERMMDVHAEEEKCRKLFKLISLNHFVPPTEDLLAKTARGVFQVDLVAQLRFCLREIDRIQFNALDTLLWYFSQQFSKYTSLNHLMGRSAKFRKRL